MKSLVVLAFVPSFFLGDWVNQPGLCGGPHVAGKHIHVTAKGIENPGIVCPMTATALSDDRFRMIAACDDDRGEPVDSLVEIWTLADKDVLTTVNDMSTRPAITWTRCP